MGEAGTRKVQKDTSRDSGRMAECKRYRDACCQARRPSSKPPQLSAERVSLQLTTRTMFYDPEHELSLEDDCAMDTSAPESPPSHDGRAKRSIEPHHDAARKQPRVTAHEQESTRVRATCPAAALSRDGM